MSEIHIVGAGPAGLMAAQMYAQNGHQVIVYEQKAAVARKFLVAGHGGFNLTHQDDYATMLTEYDHPLFRAVIAEFTNEDTVTWLQSIGIPTYVGSSGKIFPQKGIKPIAVLQAWLTRLEALGVTIKTQHQLLDFDKHYLQFLNGEQEVNVKYEKAVFAFGGLSWQKTGSDGKWITLFKNKNISITKIEPANSGFETTIDFTALEGKPLKNIAVNFQNTIKKGEIVFTNYGIEGSPIYYLNRSIRKHALPLTIYLDLKPNLSLDNIQQLYESQHLINITAFLKDKLSIQGAALTLLKKLPKAVYINPNALFQHIKQYPIEIKSFRPIDEVISTSGGLSWDALDEHLALKDYPQIQCCGEMLDWEAPTGGYLLQGCFASGYFVGMQNKITK